MPNVVRKAVFPVAGLGTRFLPATKANPKEMLPVVDKPLIQYAVSEAVASGITECIFVTSGSKRAIEDHFDKNFELEYILKKTQRADLLRQIDDILPADVSCIYVRQPEPKGLGHAVLTAKEIVGDEPFAVILADDLIHSHKPVLAQMLQCYDSTSANILAVQHIESHMSDQYGIVDVDHDFSRFGRVSGIVEKPHPEDAPSPFGVVGRYILSSEIFKILEQIEPGKGGEIQLTDAIAKLLKTQTTMALAFEGRRYDCGAKLGYLQAVVETGLRHPTLGHHFAKYLRETADSLVLEETV